MPALCTHALAAGLSALCVTDHFDDESTFDPSAYLASFNETRGLFEGRLDFLMGVELGEGHLDMNRTESLLARLPFDFVLGSCHHIEGMSDFYYLTFDDESHCLRLIEQYLDSLRFMIARGCFDVLGHLTYPLRYMWHRGFEVDFPEEGTRHVLRALAEGGLGLEVNLSGLRRGGSAMPGLSLLKLYRACGGEIVTIGSDAHRAAHVGAHLAEGYDLLRAAGFSYVALYRGRKPEYIKIG